DDNWYTDVVLKANAAGMISGYPDGTVRPNATISRQEAVAMFARVLSLDTTNAPEADFTDMDAVGDWAKDAVNAMAAKGYVNGDNGQFRPQSGITRAEVITIFNNIFDKLYAESGTYTGDVNGSAVISADDVTLENTAIDGDLIVAEGVGDGHVVLDNVTIDGKLIIRGGENSVIIRGNSSVGTVTVERIDGAVRVAVEDGASVDTLFVNDGSDTVTVEGTIGTLNVATGAAEVVLNGDTDTLNVSSENAVVTVAGTLGTVTVDEAASDATINIQSDASVSTLTTAATNTTVNVLGSVETVQIADTASNATIAVSENASVSSVTTTAQNTTVSGAGTVTNVEVGETASGATVTTPGTTVENNSSDDVTIGDGETIGAGDAATTPGGTTEEPGEPSTPSEPSRPSHTHTYVDGVCTAGDAYDPTWAQVNSAETWNAAVTAGQNIVLTADFTTDAQLTINNTNSTSGSITVNGNGHIITAIAPESGSWSDVNGSKHLVLIEDGTTTTADNVTLKNITLDSANLAYGLQAYCVTDTALDNVTLQNRVGAGLTVNGSTVDATALHTSGNNWGGVNVDQGSNVTDTTTFTFDATSTFNEGEGKAAVYSDAGNVTVNAPEGWAKVAAPTEQKPNQCVWQQLFAGGNGTEASPYLITTAQEMKNVGLLADANNHFQLQNDIDLTSVTSDDPTSTNYYNGVIDQLYGELDGANHTVTSTSDSAQGVFYNTQDAELNNITFNIDNQSVVLYATNTAFTNVTVTGEMEVGNNCGAFVTYAKPQADQSQEPETPTRSVELTFENCTANVTMLGEGASNNYNAVFVGYAYPSSPKDAPNLTTYTKLNFDNCVNNGTLICGKAAMFLGNNSANTSIVTISANNCVNRGEIRSTYTATNYGWNDFVATGAHKNNTIILDGTTLASATANSIKTEG
ncbi:S-layer homology domain-containing protein, partial [Kluyvera georgiana]|uniref:S-layer homology domain-containing protein n=1 Tax=Kluyvera georgiana TaxID=73098 RepID=UPI00321FD5FC